MNILLKNWKTTLLIILTITSGIYEIIKENAQVLGIDNKWIVLGSVILSSITLIINGIQNGVGNTLIEKLKSHF